MNVKNYYVVALFISLTLLCKASYSQQDMLGDWKITKVEIAPNASQKEKGMLGKVAQIFSKSTFHFKNDSKFSLDSPDKDFAIRDAIWKFDSTKNYIKIIERVSKGKAGLLMGITVKVVEEQYSFIMEETPIILTVKKKG